MSHGHTERNAMGTDEMNGETLQARIGELEERLAASREANRELSSQLQAKDVEIMRVQRELELRQAECIRRENESRKSTEQYRSLVSNIPGAVYRCANDANWTMEFISSPIEDLTGYPATDFIDNELRSYNSVILPEDVIKVVDAVNEGLKHHRPYTIEYRIRHRDGSVVYVYERGAGVYNDHGDLLWLDGVILQTPQRHHDDED